LGSVAPAGATVAAPLDPLAAAPPVLKKSKPLTCPQVLLHLCALRACASSEG
jgi:hypothetical protein